jgi:hypothetical protein
MALGDTGDFAGAAAAYREAIARKRDHAEAHCNLGHVLRRQGEFAKALTALRRGHRLGSLNPRWRYPSAQWVRLCQRLIDLDGQLPAFLDGKATPVSADERIELAQLCSFKRMHGAAARFYEEAFAAQPALAVELAAELRTSHRYNAACAAALAGLGQGTDGEKLKETDRTRWRTLALQWLRAELTRWRRQLNNGQPDANPAIRNTLRRWQKHADLAGVRDPTALSRLPEPEQEAWRRLWADVARTLSKAQEKR